MTPGPVVSPTIVRICPVCASGNMYEGSEQYRFSEIMTLWAEAGVSFSEGVRSSHEPEEVTVLYVCDTCGYGQFFPSWTGAQDFYDEVQDWSADYYLADKWEYQKAIQLVGEGFKTLDVGCGSGAFVRMCLDKGAVAEGLEFSQKAREMAAGAGLVVGDIDIVQMAARRGRQFDVVTSFQVLEHVADPLSFIVAQAALLREGGILVIAVPAVEGSLRWFRPVSNCPPHHVSRWTRDSLLALGERAGLTLEWIETEPLQRVHFGHLAHGWWSLIGRSPLAGWSVLGRVGELCAKALARVLRAMHVRQIPWVSGHTTVVAFRYNAPSSMHR